jgi:hypothetical protein
VKFVKLCKKHWVCFSRFQIAVQNQQKNCVFTKDVYKVYQQNNGILSCGKIEFLKQETQLFGTYLNIETIVEHQIRGHRFHLL